MRKENKSLTYVKSTDMIQMRGHVVRRDTLNETKRKIIALEASKVQPNDTPDTIYTITAKEIIELCSLQKYGKLYDQIFSEIFELKTKAIAFVDEDGKISIESYMDKIKIDRESASVTYRIPESLLPHFKMYSQFTKLDLLEYMPMRGQYALLLYELLMSWREKGEVFYTIDQLRQLLEVPQGAYPKNADFLRYVIYQPLEQVNERIKGRKIKRELKYGYRRKVEGVKFIIPKPKEIPATYEEELEELGQIPLVDESAGADPRPALLVEIAEILGNDEEAVEFWEKGEGRCRANLEYSRAHAKKDLASYLRKALAANWAKYSEAAAVAAAEQPAPVKKPRPDCPKCHGTGWYEQTSDNPRYGSSTTICDCKK